MEKKVYKVLMYIGVIWIFLAIVITILGAASLAKTGNPISLLAAIAVLLILAAPGIILVLVSWLKCKPIEGKVVKEASKAAPAKVDVKPAARAKPKPAKKAPAKKPKARKKAKKK